MAVTGPQASPLGLACVCVCEWVLSLSERVQVANRRQRRRVFSGANTQLKSSRPARPIASPFVASSLGTAVCGRHRNHRSPAENHLQHRRLLLGGFLFAFLCRAGRYCFFLPSVSAGLTVLCDSWLTRISVL